MPQLVITFVQFYGTNPSEPTPLGARFLDNQKFTGPVPTMVDATVNYILSSIRKSSLIDGILRRDIPEYPAVAIREAVINAVVHRDYSAFVRGTYIQIRLFADRLEIESPGGLFGNVTEETLETNRSTRNEALMRLMEDNQLMENRGSGIRTMNAMRAANLEPPRFEDTRSLFRVTFSNLSLMNPETITWLNQFSNRGLNDTQRLALAYLRHRTAMSNHDYQALNRVDQATAYRDLRGLVQLILVEPRGVGRGMTYALAVPADIALEQPTNVPPSVEPRTEEEKIVAWIRANGAITNERCRELLGTSRRGATRIFRQMVDGGILQRIGSKRGATYVLR